MRRPYQFGESAMVDVALVGLIDTYMSHFEFTGCQIPDSQFVVEGWCNCQETEIWATEMIKAGFDSLELRELCRARSVGREAANRLFRAVAIEFELTDVESRFRDLESALVEAFLKHRISGEVLTATCDRLVEYLECVLPTDDLFHDWYGIRDSWLGEVRDWGAPRWNWNADAKAGELRETLLRDRSLLGPVWETTRIITRNYNANVRLQNIIGSGIGGWPDEVAVWAHWSRELLAIGFQRPELQRLVDFDVDSRPSDLYSLVRSVKDALNLVHVGDRLPDGRALDELLIDRFLTGELTAESTVSIGAEIMRDLKHKSDTPKFNWYAIEQKLRRDRSEQCSSEHRLREIIESGSPQYQY